MANSGLMAVTAFVMLTALSTSSLAASPPRYVAVPVPGVGFPARTATALNEDGVVTGWVQVAATGEYRAYRWSGGALVVLRPAVGDSCSEGLAINASGHVGGLSDYSCEHIDRAAIDRGGGMEYVPLLMLFSQVNGLNDAGWMTGWQSGPARRRAFFSDGASVVDIGTLGGPTSAGRAINARGEVVGEADLPAPPATPTVFPQHAFLYSAGTMRDLGTLGGSRSSAHAINRHGHVTGFATTTGDAESHAFLYMSGGMQDLGTLGGFFSIGLGINSAGEVVGSSSIDASFTPRAFLYTGGRMSDLNALVVSGLPDGVTLREAAAINDRGQIVAWGCDSAISSCGFAYRLDPVPDEGPADVPTLAPAALAALGVLLVAVTRRRRGRPEGGGLVNGPRR